MLEFHQFDFEEAILDHAVGLLHKMEGKKHHSEQRYDISTEIYWLAQLAINNFCFLLFDLQSCFVILRIVSFHEKEKKEFHLFQGLSSQPPDFPCFMKSGLKVRRRQQ